MSVRKINGVVIDADTLDGVQEATLCTEVEADNKITTHKNDASAHHPATTIVVKASDETVNNSNTPQNDDELLFAIGANEVWEATFLIIQNSGATPDFRAAVAAPSGALGQIYAFYVSRAAAWAFAMVDLAEVIAALGASADVCYPTLRVIVVNGATAGNVQLQWSQVTADASDTIVRAKSFLIAHKIA